MTIAVNHWMVERLTRRPAALKDHVSWGEALVHKSAHVDGSARLVGPVLVGPDVTIRAGATVVGPTTVGAASTIGEGALLSRTVAWSRCAVGSGAVVDRCLLADEAVVAVSRVTPLPASVSFEAAAAFRANYCTAYYGLQRGRLRAGDVLLVLGAAGGVGLAAVDVGKLLGATVIAAASTEEKLAVCKKMGADSVVNYTQGLREQVKDLTRGRGADVIYDPVGGDVFDESMRCIAPFGRLLVVGFASGRPAQAKTDHLLIKDAEVIGFTIGALSRLDPDRERRNFDVLMGWLAAARITPHVSHRLPLARAAEALTLVRERKVIGKAVLV